MKTVTPATEIISLIDKALPAELSLDELYNLWVEDWDNDEFLERIFADLEDAIEHLPGKFFSTKVDMNTWLNSGAYRLLEKDRALLLEYQTLSTIQLLHRRTKA